MSNKAVRVGRRDLLREAIRAEKRRMLARVLGESGPERERLLREIVAANELITWYDACRTLHLGQISHGDAGSGQAPWANWRRH